jgi:UDP-N-acetylmuramate dehydrogenase
MLIEHHACLKRFNTFGVAARARRLIHLKALADLPHALEALAGQDQEPLILGGGSNLLLAGDLDATVLRIDLRGRQVIEQPIMPGEAIVEAAAGEPWHEFVLWTLEQGLYGLENLALIPGTVGASPLQNIGAYGVEMRDHFESLDAVHLDSGEIRRFTAADCGFGYRDSVFRRAESRWLILWVRFRLCRTPRLHLDYPDLRDRIVADAATPHAVSEAVIAIRRSKLPDPAVLGNAGSFFRNPVLPAAEVEALKARHPGLPAHPADQPGRSKLAAGWLIEQCGWKGHRAGDAGVHERHALVLVNHGNASGAQILALAHAIQRSVHQRFGIRLEPEPKIVGA